MTEQQTTMRRKNKVNFTQVSNELLKDKRISWKAKGIMCYLLSLPEDWKFYMSELETHSTDGVSSFRSGMKELKEFGYVERYPIKDESTKKVLYWETVLNEEAYKEDSVEIPQVEKPHVEIPQVENQTLQILSNTNTKTTNNNNNIAAVEETLKNTPNIPSYRMLSPKRKSAINARLSEYKLEEVLSAIESIALSDFFRDSYNSKANWYTIDWIFSPNNFLKIIEGKYVNKKQTQQQVVSQPPAQKIFDPSQLFAD